MNVLLISQFLWGGGLERMVHQLGEELASRYQDRVFLFAFDATDNSALRAELEKRGVTAIFSPKDDGFSWRTLREIAALIRKQEISVVHTHETAPLIYASLARLFAFRRFRIIHTQHSFLHLDRHSPRLDRYFQYAAKYVFAVSPQVQREYERMGVKSGRVGLISNGVELPDRLLCAGEILEKRDALLGEFADTVDEAAATLKAYGGDVWLIALARVSPKKGQEHLLRAWDSLSEAIRRRCVLLLVGPPTPPGEIDRLKQLLISIGNPERVVFIGATTCPLTWLQASNMFISASEYEGMPLAPLEACGAGLPVILSSIEGHQFLSEYARFFDFSNPAECAQRIAECLGELDADPTGAENRRIAIAAKIRANHGIPQMVKRYRSFYR